MQAGTEFYTGAMYGVLDAIQNGHVNAETDHYHRNEPLVHEDLDHVSRALIETGHEPLVRMILGKAGEDDYCVFSEVVNGYLLAGQFDMVVATLKKHPGKHVHFQVTEFMDKLIEAGVEDQLILDFADYLKPKGKKKERYSSSDGSFYFRELIKKLWNAGRDDLAQQIMEKYIRKKERPFFVMLYRLIHGENVEPQEIAEMFETYCPLAPKRDRGFHYWDMKKKITKVVFFFLGGLGQMEISPYLGKVALEAYKMRKQSDQFDWGVSGTYEFEARIRKELLERGDFDGAQEFADATDCTWGKAEVARARMDHVIGLGDAEAHREVLETVLRVKDEKIEGIIERDDKIQCEADIPAKASWTNRIYYYEERSEQDAERAVFELMHGTPEQAQVYIDRMIATVEQIGVPPGSLEDCPVKHQKTLRKRKLGEKRSLRERFLRAGLLDKLPQKDGWSDKIGATAGQREASRERSRALKKERAECQNIDWQDSWRQANVAKTEVVRKALQQGPDQAIAALKEQINFRSDDNDWANGVMILEAHPDKFTELNELLSKDYFETGYEWKWRGSHDGMVKFYMDGKRLGVVGEVEWNALFEKWRNARRVYDSGDRPLPRDAVLAMVHGFLEDGDWPEAIRYYRKAQKIDVDRRTRMECLAHLIRASVAAMPDEEKSGAAVLFKDGQTLEGATPRQQLEYWNSKVEWALMEGNQEDYDEAYEALMSFLETPPGVQVWTRLMMAGSFRSPHQKKDALLEAHGLHRECAEARWNIVHAMIDHEIPGAVAMPEIKSKDTPFEVVVPFFEKLIAKGVLDPHTAEYLTEEHLPYLRRVLAQHQNQFNTVMEVIDENLNGPRVKEKKRRWMLEDEDDDDEEVVEERKGLEARQWPGVLTVLREVGVLTPGIYAEAKACNFDSKMLAEIGKKVAILKRDLFSNKAVDSDMTPELMAELIWAGYQPANMKLSEVQKLCGEVSDCSQHLERFTFPEHGYELDLLTNRTMHLRRGAQLVTPPRIYSPIKVQQREDDFNKQQAVMRHRQRQVSRLCEVGKLKMGQVSLSDILVVFKKDPFMRGAFKEWSEAQTDDDRYRALRRNQEALGVYLEDNLEDHVFQFLKLHELLTSGMVERLVKNLKKPGKRRAIEQQLGVTINDKQSNIRIAAKVIAQAALQKFGPLQDMRRAISGDVRSFVTEKGEEVSSNASLRAVVSKNKASFFAKASAGICTARNIKLFEREDHFHINLIDDREERCVGNVQAYIMKREGKEYLLLRGLNPSTKLLKEIDVESLCEAIIAIGKRFARENRLDGVMLSEQGGFLALSNRDEMTSYVEKAYADKLVNISEFDISNGHMIKRAYVVAQRPKGKPRKSRKRRSRTPVREDAGLSMVA